LCTRTVGALAHTLEAEGLSTVSFAGIREHAKRIKTPRTLYCEFPLGRPLGVPGDAAFQRKVLEAAFALLDVPEGPVLVDYPETIADATDEPLTCPLPPQSGDGLPEEIAEADSLHPAYDRARAEYGRTNVGRLVDADGMSDVIESLIRVKEGTPVTKAGFPRNDIFESTKDLRSYYEEAAVGLVGHIPRARAAESWFYQKTATGKLMKDVKAKLLEAEWPNANVLMPGTQR
jgi:hypothetical protein